MAAIQARDGEVFKRQYREAVKLYQHPGKSITKRGHRMIEIVDLLASKVAPAAACKRGCSHCCYQAVSVTRWEAERIAVAIGVAASSPPTFAPNDDEIAAMRAAYTSKACPFLKNNECSIYDVRPFVCRTQFNMGDDPTACDTINRPGESVPYFNFSTLNLMVAAMFFQAGHGVGDIREFFPSK